MKALASVGRRCNAFAKNYGFDVRVVGFGHMLLKSRQGPVLEVIVDCMGKPCVIRRTVGQQTEMYFRYLRIVLS